MIKEYINANNSGNIINYEIIINQENVGTVKNMNGALKQAQGEIIIPLAADDIFYNDHVITDIVKRFAETKCEIMSCSRLMFSNDMTQEIRLMPHIGYRGYIERHMNTAQKQYKQMSLGRSYEFASGAALYYRTSLMKRLGWYDERYVLWEDGPLLARCAREGIKICTAWPNMLILSSGVVINIVINYFLIPVLGIEGAAIATLLGYVVSDVICVVVLCKMKLMVINFKFVLATIIMMIYIIAWRLMFSNKILIGTISAIIVSIIMIFLYREDLKRLLAMIKKKK